jgi:putative membrane protein
MNTKQIIITIIVVLLLIVLFQNLDIIKIQLLFWTIDISLLLIILLPFILGGIVGWLTKSSSVKKKKIIDKGASTSPPIT